jgi:hypothetical protein
MVIFNSYVRLPEGNSWCFFKSLRIPSAGLSNQQPVVGEALAIHQACLQEPPVPEWESLGACVRWPNVLVVEREKKLGYGDL